MSTVNEQSWKPKANPWLIAASVMLATFLEVLDTTIAAVSLNHIAGSLSATYDQATWVLTSYLVANAVVLPASSWFGQKFGRKRFLLVCLLIFTGANLLCGLAVSLPMLLMMRVIQGAGGGALQPISQAVLMESFPQEQQGRAMGVYGLGVVLAPVIGPVLGGWITDNYSWRWIFHIKVPLGLLAFWMISKYVEDPPWVKSQRAGTLDTIGFGFMGLWLACQEIFLDKGQELDWFGSHFIMLMVIVAVMALVFFVVRELKAGKPIVNLRVLGNRNFGVGSFLMGFVGALLYGMTTIVPIFLETLLGYPAFQAGIAMIPRGLGSFFAMPAAGKLTEKMDGRLVVGAGFVLFGWSSYLFSRVTLDISPWSLFFPLFINGLAVGFVFVPLNVLAMGSLPKKDLGNASGIFNLMRNMGGSVGIAAVTTFLQRRAQVHQNVMVGHLSPGDVSFRDGLHKLASYMQIHAPGGTPDSLKRAAALLYRFLLRQSYLWAFVDIFVWTVLICALCVAVTMLLRKTKSSGGPVAMH